jgi:hypothetical protein
MFAHDWFSLDGLEAALPGLGVDTQVFVTLNTYKPFSRINPEQSSSVKGAELPGKG